MYVCECVIGVGPHTCGSKGQRSTNPTLRTLDSVRAAAAPPRGPAGSRGCGWGRESNRVLVGLPLRPRAVPGGRRAMPMGGDGLGLPGGARVPQCPRSAALCLRSFMAGVQGVRRWGSVGLVLGGLMAVLLRRQAQKHLLPRISCVAALTSTKSTLRYLVGAPCYASILSAWAGG